MYQNPFTERFLVIAEKPSVARTIAQILVCEDKKDGEGEGRCWTWRNRWRLR